MSVTGVGRGLGSDRHRNRLRQIAVEGARGEQLAVAVEHQHRAADGGCDRRRQLVDAPFLEHQPLESPLHRDASLQDLVLLIDQPRERLLGEGDERHRVGHLEEREVMLLGFVDERLGQLAVVKPGAEPEAGQVVVRQPSHEGALLRGAL